MKALVIPATLLAGMLAFSLWCESYVEENTLAWESALTEADGAAWREDWQGANTCLKQVYGSWQEAQTPFHALLSHQGLEEAERLFVGILAACREEDSPDLHTMLAQLRAVLSHMREEQSCSVRNIF